MSTSSPSTIGNQRNLSIAVVITAFLSLSFVTLFNYTRVPFWDSWDLFGWLAAGDRSIALLWGQHNEHRIVLTKILAVIDFETFGGHGVLLVISNLLLGVALFALIAFMMRELFKGKNQELLWAVIALAGITGFSLMQFENYGWEFQPQFFLAYLIPLASIKFFLGASTGSNLSMLGGTLVGLLLAILALGSMANGVLTAFVLALGAILQRRWVASALAFIVAVTGSYMYFVSYSSPGGSHSTLSDAINNPVQLGAHFVALIGSPVRHLLGGGYLAAGMAVAIGSCAFLTSLYCVFRVFINNRDNPSLVSFASSIVFILLSLAVISVGRFSFGMAQAFSARYTTPVFALWLLILGLALYFRSKHERERSDRAFVWAVVAIFSVSQLLSMEAVMSSNSHRQVAALAVASGVPDLERVSQLFPNPEVVAKVSVEMAAKGKGIFGELVAANGTSSPRKSEIGTNCTGYVDEVFPIPNSEIYRVRGWITFDSWPYSFRYQIASLASSSIDFLDGHIARGLLRVDVAQTQGISSLFSGFEGYVFGTKPNTGSLLNCSAQRVF